MMRPTKSVLLYFTAFFRGVGGSEFLVFSLIRDLQARGCSVTLALQSPGIDPLKAVDGYGISIDKSALKVIPLFPDGRFLKWMDRHLKCVWRMRLRRLGPQHDVCISCANPVDFGRPGIHFIHMLTFGQSFLCAREWHGDVSLKRALCDVTQAFVGGVTNALLGVRSAAKIVRSRKERVFPNSAYVKSAVERRYGVRIEEVFYPPTLFTPSHDNVKRHPFDIACVGRIAPEKRLESLVAIVEEARRIAKVDFRLRVVGAVTADGYGLRVRQLADRHSWVVLEGMRTGDEKSRILQECRFALHACRVEAFGISVTEYLKADLVPLVPQEGGSAEIVAVPDVVYKTEAVGARILARLVLDNAFYVKCLTRCRRRAEAFSAEAYWRRQSALLDNVLQ